MKVIARAAMGENVKVIARNGLLTPIIDDLELDLLAAEYKLTLPSCTFLEFVLCHLKTPIKVEVYHER